MLNSFLIIVSLYLGGLLFYLSITRINEKDTIYFGYITGLVWGSLLYIVIFMAVLIFYQGTQLLEYTWGTFCLVCLYCFYLSYQKINIKHILSALTLVFIFYIAVSKLSILILSADSFWIVHFSKQLALGDFDQGSVVLSMWGVFLAAIHSNSFLSGEYIFYSYAPLMSLSLILVYLFSLHRIFDFYTFQQKYKIKFILLSLSILLLSNLFIYSFFVIHTGMISALFLFLFVMHWLWYENSYHNEHLIFASLALLGFSLLRIESPLIGVLFLFLLLSKQTISLKKKQSVLFFFLIIFIIWYFFLFFHIPTEHDLLGNKEITIMLLFFSLSLIFVGLLKFSYFQKLYNYLDNNLVYLFLVVTIGLILYAPKHMLLSILHIFQNLFVTGGWGLTWYFLTTLFIYIRYIKKIKRFSQLDKLEIIVMLYFLFTYIIVIARVPYRLGDGDSANRMILHIFPLIVFYLSVYMMNYFNDAGKNENFTHN